MKLVNMILFCKNRPLDLFSRLISYTSKPPFNFITACIPLSKVAMTYFSEKRSMVRFSWSSPIHLSPISQTSSLCTSHQHRSPSHEIRSPWRSFVKIESGYRGRIRIQIPIPVSHSPASPLHALHRHMTDHEIRSPVGPQLDFTVSPVHTVGKAPTDSTLGHQVVVKAVSGIHQFCFQPKGCSFMWHGLGCTEYA